MCCLYVDFSVSFFLQNVPPQAKVVKAQSESKEKEEIALRIGDMITVLESR